MPGTYTVKLDVEGKSMTAPLELKLDPDVRTRPEDLQKQSISRKRSVMPSRKRIKR
jgi:hypothetical protein